MAAGRSYRIATQFNGELFQSIAHLVWLVSPYGDENDFYVLDQVSVVSAVGAICVARAIGAERSVP